MPIISLTYALLHVCIKFDWLGLRNKRQIWKSSFLAYFANVQFSDLLYEHAQALVQGNQTGNYYFKVTQLKIFINSFVKTGCLLHS